MDAHDKIFDILVELTDFTHDNGLHVVSRRLEDALDAFLVETGRLPASEAGEAVVRPKRPRPRAVQRAVPGRVVRQTVRTTSEAG